MHTSFEDLRGKQGQIYRQNDDGEFEWEKPNREWSVLWGLALAMAFPLAFCVTFYALG